MNFTDKEKNTFVSNSNSTSKLDSFDSKNSLTVDIEATCIGCLENQPNQQAHMGTNGCLSLSKRSRRRRHRRPRRDGRPPSGCGFSDSD